mmetsp:Transcript_15785/g.43140  ORF Transcript_15785/g.43140 Transcript_15785/m.43140 type:complete len:259 (+) Transcript_15785:1066-1842(+)
MVQPYHKSASLVSSNKGCSTAFWPNCTKLAPISGEAVPSPSNVQGGSLLVAREGSGLQGPGLPKDGGGDVGSAVEGNDANDAGVEAARPITVVSTHDVRIGLWEELDLTPPALGSSLKRWSKEPTLSSTCCCRCTARLRFTFANSSSLRSRPRGVSSTTSAAGPLLAATPSGAASTASQLVTSSSSAKKRVRPSPLARAAECASLVADSDCGADRIAAAAAVAATAADEDRAPAARSADCAGNSGENAWAFGAFRPTH